MEKDEKISEALEQGSIFSSPSMDELENTIEEKEEEIEVPEFEDETQSVENDSLNPDENNSESIQGTRELLVEDELLLQKKYEENMQKVGPWEELDSKNDIVKRYILYVDKENIEAIDKLTIDERNAFINSAIKMKFEDDDDERKKIKKARLILHSTIMISTMIIFMPIAFYLAHKCIVATFNNYKYSQDNFEKLYRKNFSKNPTYIKAQKYSHIKF